MKIIVTGHTKGIGKALAGTFSKYGHEVVGFSRSNGFDISSEEVRNKIIQDSVDADVFINNAYDAVGQTELLKGMISAWETAYNKQLINISSKLVYLEGDISAFKEYIDQKKLQNEICNARQTIAHPKVLNILPGMVDTEMSRTVFDSPRMNPLDLSEFVYIIATRPRVRVSEIIVDVPELNWKDIKLK